MKTRHIALFACALFGAQALSPPAEAQNARNNGIVQELGRIGIAAELCGFPLTEGYLSTRRQMREGWNAEWFNTQYEIGYSNGRSAAALGGELFCSASCVAHGPAPLGAPRPLQAFVSC